MFLSDNASGLCPEAMAAIVDANTFGHQRGYGDDELSARAIKAFNELLGDDIGVWFVATGTAANTLAIAAMTEPWQNVVCLEHSHWNDDESTAPERMTNCRCVPVRVADGTSKITPDVFTAATSQHRGDVHQPQPGVLTISNVTEFGEVYTPDEVAALCTVAHERGFRMHMDGARFANAVAALGCDPRDLTSRAGLDALSFGGTKNGLAFGEAVIFFEQGDGANYERANYAFPFLRKGSGHLLSKHRFVTAPFAATLTDGSWLRHASHANAMARKLSDGLATLGCLPAFPTEANGVFTVLTDAIDARLKAAGHGYYPFGDAAWNIKRLMCGFDTQPEDIDAALADARDGQQ